MQNPKFRFLENFLSISPHFLCLFPSYDISSHTFFPSISLTLTLLSYIFCGPFPSFSFYTLIKIRSKNHFKILSPTVSSSDMENPHAFEEVNLAIHDSEPTSAATSVYHNGDVDRTQLSSLLYQALALISSPMNNFYIPQRNRK